MSTTTTEKRNYKTLEEYQYHHRRTSNNAINNSIYINQQSSPIRSKQKVKLKVKQKVKMNQTQNVNQTNQRIPQRSPIMKPIAPPPSSSLPTRRRSPHREKERDVTNERDVNIDRDHNSNRHRKPTSSNSKNNRNNHMNKSPVRQVQQFFRKSAIQDVLKTFQCSDKNNKDNINANTSTVHVKKRSHKYPTANAANATNNANAASPNSNKQSTLPQPHRGGFNPLDNSLLQNSDAQSAFHPLIQILLMNLPLNIMILIIIVHSIISSNNNSNNRKRLLRSNNYSPTRFKHANHNFKKMKTEKLQSPKSLLPGSLNSIVAMEIGARVGIRIQRKNNNRMYMMVGEMMPS
jgi:hypothetical protein